MMSLRQSCIHPMWLFWCLAATSGSIAAQLHVEICPQFGGQPLMFDRAVLTNHAGQSLSVRRLDLLLSQFEFWREDGTSMKLKDECVFISAREGRTRFALTVSPGEYRRIRFVVGLRPELNHSDPARFPAEHPLNPRVNGLHWSWQGGYVFLALEGNWIRADSTVDGYSFHLATDSQAAVIDLPLDFEVKTNANVLLILDIAKLLSMPLSHETSSTHSRPDDRLADQLRQHLQGAFRWKSKADPAAGTATALKVGKRTSETLSRTDTAADATPFRFSYPAYFPQPALPRDNPLTDQGVELGRALFEEPLLSINGKQSCASCHQLSSAFTDRGQRFSAGAEGKEGTRNSMPLLNLAWKSSLFWDGRAPSLRQQVLMPIENEIEMHESLSNVVQKLACAKQLSSGVRTPDYATLFARAFGSSAITSERIARALEQFVVTRMSCDSKFDRALAGTRELTNEEKRGFELFHTEYDPRHGMYGADCFHCHGGPLFQSQSFANNGLDAMFTDPGRFGVTGQKGDEGKFAVPSLRNVEVTAPYMHDGRFSTLEQVVEHYSTGLKRSATLDPNLAKHPDNGVPMTPADKRALVAFLKTLTDERYHSATLAINSAPR